jgi:hypothetical protein
VIPQEHMATFRAVHDRSLTLTVIVGAVGRTSDDEGGYTATAVDGDPFRAAIGPPTYRERQIVGDAMFGPSTAILRASHGTVLNVDDVGRVVDDGRAFRVVAPVRDFSYSTAARFVVEWTDA